MTKTNNDNEENRNMRWRHSILAHVLPVALAATTIGVALPAQAAHKVVVLMDRSGSMAEIGVCLPGKKKGFCGLDTVQGRIQSVYEDPNIDENSLTFWFWEFADPIDSNCVSTTVNQQFINTNDLPGALTLDPPCLANTTFTKDYAFVGPNGYSCLQNAIQFAKDHLQTAFVRETQNCNGPNTPLAQAYCQAVTHLRANSNPNTDTNHILIVSDGAQNFTSELQNVDCHGPDSALTYPLTNFPNRAYPDMPQAGYSPVQITMGNWAIFGTDNNSNTSAFLQVGSWQANILDVGISGGIQDGMSAFRRPWLIAELPGNAFKPNAGGNLTISQPTFVQDFVAGPLLAAADIDNPLLSFLDGLARSTGSRLTVPGNTFTGDQFGEHLVAGDINDDGCVNATDFNLLKASFNKPSTFSAAAKAADINYTGVVDDRDYFYMKSVYGTGCATPPGAIPVLGGALFGFGNRPDWAPAFGSPVPLSLAMGVTTEGTTALKIGNAGFREFKSIDFSSSLFAQAPPTTKSKLLVDVFIPPVPGNPTNPWLGEIQMFVNCPSRNVYHQHIGTVSLNGKPTNQFAKNLQFTLPTGSPQFPVNIRNLVNSGSCPNFALYFSVNSNQAGHVFDNIHFQ